MKKKVLNQLVVMVVILLFAGTAVAASEIMFTWVLPPAGEDIVEYRYQIGGEDPDNWNYVDADPDGVEVEVGPLDRNEPHELYLQQSFDGEIWSESSVGVYEPAN